MTVVKFKLLRYPVSPNADPIPLDSDVMGTYGYLVGQLNPLGLVYIQRIEGETTGPRNIPDDMSFLGLRRRFDGRYIANNAYDVRLATRTLRNGLADLIALGRPFIANPDLVTRLRYEWMLAEAPKETWYGGGTKGYIGLPTYRRPPKDAAGDYGQGF
jgi:N-ethylmaleimide reductase